MNMLKRGYTYWVKYFNEGVADAQKNGYEAAKSPYRQEIAKLTQQGNEEDFTYMVTKMGEAFEIWEDKETKLKPKDWEKTIDNEYKKKYPALVELFRIWAWG
jgi:hypothetical protein